MEKAELLSLTDEEWTRYNNIFFALEPIDGLLSGEKARELLLCSKLPLPVLSKVWNLVDVPPDNLLDHVEFAHAVHLLRHVMRGHPLPATLPPNTAGVTSQPEAHVSHMSGREYTAYTRLFDAVKRDWQGRVEADTARALFLSSGLPCCTLAHIWNLSDSDRDGRLSLEEFTIACHLIRFSKKGKELTGPVNVQSLLPDRISKTDLIAKRRKLQTLEKRKFSLMALREKRREQATREGRRVELWRERLKILTAMHQALRDDDNDVCTHTDDVMSARDQQAARAQALQRHEHALKDLQTVAGRLKRCDEQVRQQTARVIIAEQRLSLDVTSLQNEADKLRQRSKRSSALKDIDPFHQLYEQRKEEKRSGVAASPRKENAVKLPQHLDPFDREALEKTLPSGQRLFGLDPTESIEDSEMDSNPWSVGDLGAPDEASAPDPAITALTHGFEDNFVEKWAGSASSDRQEELANPVLTGIEEDFALDEEDTVFKTVPVTAEDDELWSTLPVDEKAHVAALQRQLSDVTHRLSDLSDQVFFRDQADYVKFAEHQQPRSSPALTRHASDSAIRHQHVTDVTRTRPFSFHGNEARLTRTDDRSDRQTNGRTTTPLQGVHEEESLRLNLDFLNEDDSSSSDHFNSGGRSNDSKTSPAAANQNSHTNGVIKDALNESGQSRNGDVRVLSDSQQLESRHSDFFLADVTDTVQSLPADFSYNRAHTASSQHVPLTESVIPAVKPSVSGIGKVESRELTDTLAKESRLNIADSRPKSHDSDKSARDSSVSTSGLDNSNARENIAVTLPVTSHAPVSQVTQSLTVDTDLFDPWSTEVVSKGDTTQKTGLLELSAVATDTQTQPQRLSQPNLSVDSHTQSNGQSRSVSINTNTLSSNQSEHPVQLRRNTPEKTERALKSQTWHPQDAAPIPPPRKRSPRKLAQSSSTLPRSSEGFALGLSFEESILTRSISEKNVSKSEFKEASHSLPLTPPLRQHSPSKKRRAPAPPGRPSLSGSSGELSPLSPVSSQLLRSHSPGSPARRPASVHSSHPSLSSPASSPSPRSPPPSLPPDSPRPVAPPRTKRASRKKVKQVSDVSLTSEHDSVLTSSDAQSVTSETTITSPSLVGASPPDFKETLINSSDLQQVQSKSEREISHAHSDSTDSGIISPAVTTQSSPSNVRTDSRTGQSLVNTNQNQSKEDIDTVRVNRLIDSLPWDRLILKSGNQGNPQEISGDNPDNFTRAQNQKNVPVPAGLNRADSGLDFQTNENEFKKEIEALFDQVTEFDDLSSSFSKAELPKTEPLEVENDNTRDASIAFIQTLNSKSTCPTHEQVTIKENDPLLASAQIVTNVSDSNQIKDQLITNLEKTETSDINELLSKNTEYKAVNNSAGQSMLPLKIEPNVTKDAKSSDLKSVTESAKRSEPKTASDYFSQSESSIIDDDMETVARKQELEKLRGLYFGGENKSPIHSPTFISPQTSPRSPIGNITPTFSAQVEDPHEPAVVVLNDPTRLPDGTRKRFKNATVVDIVQDKPPISQYDSPKSPNTTAFTSPAQGPFSAKQAIVDTKLDKNSNTEDTSVYTTVLDNTPLANPVAKYMRDHVIKKEELVVGLQTNYIAQKPVMDRTASRDSDDSDTNFEATFDPRKTKVNIDLTAPQDSSDITLISYQPTPLSPGRIVPLRLGDSPREEKQGNMEVNWGTINSTEVRVPPLPSIPPPPLPSSLPPVSATPLPEGGLESDSYTGSYKRLNGIYDLGSEHEALRSEKTGVQPSYTVNSTKDTLVQHTALGNNRKHVTFDDRASGARTASSGDHSSASGHHSLIQKPSGASVTETDCTRTTTIVNADIITNNQYTIGISDKSASSAQTVDNSISDSDSPREKVMDPLTGLRRTTASTPVEKAIRFVQDTEPSFRVKKLPSVEYDDEDTGSYLTGLKTRAQEIEQERAEILDEMRMRKKTLTSWLGDEIVAETGKDEKTHSERLYEERKKKFTVTMPSSQERQTEKIYREHSPADIDSRSLTDQKQTTIREWENKFASPDTQLYPKSPTLKSPIHKTPAPHIVSPVIKGTDYSEITKSRDHESAIEREIRLAQEREAELKRERARLSAQVHENEQELKVDTDKLQSENPQKATMPIHKVPVLSPTRASVNTAPLSPVSPPMEPSRVQRPPQTYQEMTEADRDTLKKESIIEREIREQLAREEEMMRRGKLEAQHSKEAEQSEFERAEKERERVRAHESIIEREIREQQERERELHVRYTHGPASPRAPAMNSHEVPRPAPAVAVPQPQQSLKPAMNHYSSHSESETESNLEHAYDPNTGRVDQSIAYVDAIAGGTHRGESMIARELREQREREEELRSQWKSAGIDVPLVTLEPADTPYNMPEPYQSPHAYQPPAPKHTPNRLGGTLSASRQSVDSECSVATDHSYLDNRDSAQTQVSAPIRPKVQPYVSSDDEDEDNAFRYAPVNETPVEKEIRLAREREEALRAEKGLSHEDSTREVVIEVSTPSRGRGPANRRPSENDRGTMQRLASGRLHQEMVREKQREVELKHTGQIATLSEERVGALMSYRDIIPKDAGAPPVPNTVHYAGATPPKARPHSSHSQSSSQATSSDELDAPPKQNGTAHVQKQTKHHVQVSHVSQRPVQKVPTPVNAQRAPPPVRATSPMARGSGPVKSGAVTTESIIERELREQREREEELRRQREMVSVGKRPATALPPRHDDVIDDTPTLARLSSSQSDDVTLRQHNGVTQDSRMRRKSALAAEWEKKFGAAPPTS